MSKNNISFILNKPQLSENIGACARAIKNFNFKKLVLINPKPIFPNDKIIATSVGAKDIIKQSKNYDTLEKAISKKKVVYYGSNKNKRKYTYIDDATSCTIKVLRSNYKNKIINLVEKPKNTKSNLAITGL